MDSDTVNDTLGIPFFEVNEQANMLQALSVLVSVHGNRKKNYRF